MKSQIFKKRKELVLPKFPQAKSRRGFSLAEFLIALGIFSLIIVAVTAFQKDTFFLNSVQQNQLNAEFDAMKVVRIMVGELRAASTSNTGSYPIESATASSLIFYSDIDSNGLKERVRYFLSGTDLKKGVVRPSGSPLSYNLGSEQVITLVSGFSATSDLFSYYDTNYDGVSDTALVQPVSPSAIRLVKISVVIDKDPKKVSMPISVTSQVSIRNLKDNL